MRAISFGKLAVPNHGVPLQLGRSFLSASMTVADESMSVNSAAPFCQDMIPFKADVEPSTSRYERVMVVGMTGTTLSVHRGIDGTDPASHPTSAVVVAVFPFAGWDLGSPCGGAGRVYWGKSSLVASTGAGVIKEFVPNPASASVSDSAHFMSEDAKGNPLNLTDFGMDVDVDGGALFATLWER